MKLSKLSKRIIALILAIPSSLALFFGSLLLHIQIYKAIYPNQVTEIEHNINLKKHIYIHFFIAVPIFYTLSVLLIIFLLNKLSKKSV